MLAILSVNIIKTNIVEGDFNIKNSKSKTKILKNIVANFKITAELLYVLQIVASLIWLNFVMMVWF
jgi:hypothetical protein